jgi:hypothetical protein
MLYYVYDSNYVKVIPIKSRYAWEWVKYYDHIHQELTVKGFRPKLQTLDNEASAALKIFFTANDVAYHLVLPHCHRRNAAERAIRNFKEHFVAGLSLVDPTFPLHLWDILFPQAEIKLNLLRTSILHPQLSSAAHCHGLVDYNNTALSPPGCKIIAHEKPGKQHTWALHRQHGFSLGPAMHHYRCQNVYISAVMLYKTLIWRCHSLMSGMTPSQPLQSWQKFSNSNYPKKTSHPSSCASYGQSTPRLRRIIQSNLSLSMAPPRQTRSQTTIHDRDITNEGGHTNGAQSVTSKGAHALTEYIPPQLVPKRHLRHGNCPHGHLPRKSPLVPVAPTNAVIHPITRKEMEYMALMKDPRLQPLWKRGFGN